MSAIDDIGQHAIPVGDAIREVQEALKNAKLDTSQKIAFKMAARADVAEGKLQSMREQVRRGVLQYLFDVFTPDDLIDKSMEYAQKKRK